MWTATLDLSPKRVILTNILGRFWRGAYFSSFAPLRVQNTPRQHLPGTGWVRVRNRLAGICGSDLHLIYADGDLRVAPAALPNHTHVYLGHEVVGEVIEIGDDVQQLQVGDRVVLQHGINCLSSGVQPLCRSCASGNYGLCERGTLPGPHPIGGGWSEEMLLHEQQLFRVPADMTDTQAVLLEPSAVAVHAVLRHVPQAGDRVLIIGAGTIGLLTLQVVRTLAPQAEVSVQARYPFQVEKATRMGAAHIIYPQDSYHGVQQATQAQLYKGILGNQMLLGGYDVIYDTIGTQGTIHNALRWARAKATIVLVGLSLHMMHIDLTPVWFQEVNLIGTLGQGMETWPIGTREQRSTFSITTDMITHGLLHPEHLITHHFALNNYRQALMTAVDKGDQRTVKVVFDYSLLPASVVPNVRASARHRRQAIVDLNATPALVTKDLAQKEAVHSLTEHTVTPLSTMPPSSARFSEVQPRIVPLPASVVQEHVLPSQPVAHDVVQEIPVQDEEAAHKFAKTIDTTSSVKDETTQDPVSREQNVESFNGFDEAPLSELEWLDVIAAEHVTSEEQQYVPDEVDAPPPLDTQPTLPEDMWLEEDFAVHEEIDQDHEHRDLSQDAELEEVYPGVEDGETNASRETLFHTKTPKAMTPDKSRSRYRH
ncbi:MAG: hypothetical protein NVS4B12_28770 [Ktedonobacteraceae bacterium]